jgi:hypothetical protein
MVQVVLMVVQVANPPRPGVVYDCNITVNVSAGGHINTVGGDEAGDGHLTVACREPRCGSVCFSPPPTP